MPSTQVEKCELCEQDHKVKDCLGLLNLRHLLYSKPKLMDSYTKFVVRWDGEVGIYVFKMIGSKEERCAMGALRDAHNMGDIKRVPLIRYHGYDYLSDIFNQRISRARMEQLFNIFKM